MRNTATFIVTGLGFQNSYKFDQFGSGQLWMYNSAEERLLMSTYDSWSLLVEMCEYLQSVGYEFVSPASLNTSSPLNTIIGENITITSIMPGGNILYWYLKTIVCYFRHRKTAWREGNGNIKVYEVNIKTDDLSVTTMYASDTKLQCYYMWFTDLNSTLVDLTIDMLEISRKNQK